MKVKLRKADKKFTELVRRIYDYTCQRCGKRYVIDGVKVGNLANLGVSHYWSRRHEATRFDLDNVTLFCNFPCHTGENGWECEKKSGEYYNYMIKRLGQKGFDLLEFRAHQYQKKDDFTILLWIEQELGDMPSVQKRC